MAPIAFARYEPVADIVQARAAIFGIDRRAEQLERAHLRHDLTIEAFVEKRRGHARQQRITRIGSRRVADHPLLFAQFGIELVGVERVERLDALRIGAGHETGFLYRSEEPTSALQSLMRISYALLCLIKIHSSLLQPSTH